MPATSSPEDVIPSAANGLAISAGRSDSTLTGATNRYPRRANVSTKRGLSAESPNASRILLMAVPSEWSKSTTVSLPHTLSCRSSRVTTSPGCSNRVTSTLNGWLCSLIFRPAFQSSPLWRSTSNRPKTEPGNPLHRGQHNPATLYAYTNSAKKSPAAARIAVNRSWLTRSCTDRYGLIKN